jgi:hypothetical protein
MRGADWWVYESWKVRPTRARVHYGKCPFCNNGKGFGKRHTRVSVSGARWHGPFPDSVEAMDFARGLGRADTHICALCLRYVRS